MIAQLTFCSVCFNADICCEATPHPVFQNWDPVDLAPIDDSTMFPESPLHCPRREMFTVLGHDKCSPFTYELLSDMR